LAEYRETWTNGNHNFTRTYLGAAPYKKSMQDEWWLLVVDRNEAFRWSLTYYLSFLWRNLIDNSRNIYKKY
jgi:hypothetical protein